MYLLCENRATNLEDDLQHVLLLGTVWSQHHIQTRQLEVVHPLFQIVLELKGKEREKDGTKKRNTRIYNDTEQQSSVQYARARQLQPRGCAYIETLCAVNLNITPCNLEIFLLVLIEADGILVVCQLQLLWWTKRREKKEERKKREKYQ